MLRQGNPYLRDKKSLEFGVKERTPHGYGHVGWFYVQDASDIEKMEMLRIAVNLGNSR